jgi:hypothetical protein
MAIFSICLSLVSIGFSAYLYTLINKKVEEPVVEKKDPYKDWRDPETGLLRARKIKNL